MSIVIIHIIILFNTKILMVIMIMFLKVNLHNTNFEGYLHTTRMTAL